MKYLRVNPNGVQPPPQSNPAPGLIPLTDEQAATLTDYNGFVTVEQTPDGITVTPNLTAWEIWKSSIPPTPAPTPTTDERLAALESAMLSMMGV